MALEGLVRVQKNRRDVLDADAECFSTSKA